MTTGRPSAGPRFPSLWRLGGEFVRVARTESRERRRRSRRRVAVALAVALLVVPGSLAIGWGGDSNTAGRSSAGFAKGSVLPSTPVIPGTATDFPPDESGDVDFSWPGLPPAWLVEDCHGGDPSSRVLHCEAIIAIAEGRLAPGEYSDEELRALLGSGGDRER